MLALALLWPLNLAALAIGPGQAWSVELWSGTVLMAALVGSGLALLATPPALPQQRADDRRSMSPLTGQAREHFAFGSITTLT